METRYILSRGRFESKPCSLTETEKKPNGNKTKPVTKAYPTKDGIPFANGSPLNPSGAFLRGKSITPSIDSCISGKK